MGCRTHEEVVGVWVGAADLEKLHQIVELAVDVTTDGDWTFLDEAGEHEGGKAYGVALMETYNRLDVGLFLENLSCLNSNRRVSHRVL